VGQKGPKHTERINCIKEIKVKKNKGREKKMDLFVLKVEGTPDTNNQLGMLFII